MWLILIILGIVAEILKANAILVIPSIVEYILFGLGGFLLLVQIISYFTAKKQFNKMPKRFDRFWVATQRTFFSGKSANNMRLEDFYLKF